MYSLRTRIKSRIIFAKIINLLEYIGDSYKIQHYKNAIYNLNNKISLSDSFHRKVEYIKNMPDKEYLEYPGLIKLLKIQKLSNVYGFGFSLLNSIANDKRSVEKYIRDNMNKFTDVQRRGLKYWQKLSTNIKRDIVTKIYDKIERVLTKFKSILGIKSIDIVGSYRREKQDNLGDIDILVLSDGNAQDILNIIKKYLKKIYVTELTGGDKKTTFLIKVPKFIETPRKMNENVMYTTADDYKELKLKGYGNSSYIQVDLMVIDKKSYPYALIYFTGSKLFNIMMRKKANSMGYTLNEYGIREIGKEEYLFNFKKEAEIIKFFGLDLKYIDPQNRNA